MKTPVALTPTFTYLLALGVLAALTLAGFHSFLFFHTVSEIICIVIGCGAFMLAWNARHIVENDYLPFLGIAFLFTAILDLFHLMAYTGMHVFEDMSTNLPTQLWMAGRFVQSVSLLIAPVFIVRRMNARLVSAVYVAACGLVLASIFLWPVFPTCYVEGKGVTAFKEAGEFFLCLLLVAGIVHLRLRRTSLDSKVYWALVASMTLMVISELFFANYLDPYGTANVLGHVFKIVAYFLIYKAIIETGVMRPYAVVYRNLKRSEEHLRKAHAELVELFKLKDQFLRVAVHDLRNPIAIIKSYARYLASDDQRESAIAAINSSCDQMIELVDDFLNYNRFQSGRFELNRYPTSLGSLVRDLAENLALLACKKSITLRADVQADLPFANVDPVRINEALRNLVTNAIHFTYPNTEITLTARHEGNHEVTVSVTDQGPGIPENEIPRLFTEFGRTSVRPTGGEHSTGLGLAIVKLLIEAHGGRVWVKSQVGKGSTFAFSVPIAAQSPPRKGDREHTEAETTTPAPSAGPDHASAA